MRTTSALKTAALLIVAVVLALGTVQGSLAVWNTATSTSAGTVQAADFAVTLQSGSTEPQRLPVNGAPAKIQLPGLNGLKPGEKRTVRLTVTDDTDAGLATFRIRVTASADVSDGAADYLTTTAEFSCSDKSPAKGPSSADLEHQGSATLCVTVTLKSDAPATAGGQTSNLSVELTATQL
ncbi:hypothetical protein ACT3S2_14205 [Arthrobacter sp. AOP36-A1-22]|uniref:hypothetical protein n=1 Tax=Arthrobacter sp. AOP36-A1-22 TaxID=3457684 RepID=UPI004033CA35